MVLSIHIVCHVQKLESHSVAVISNKCHKLLFVANKNGKSNGIGQNRFSFDLLHLIEKWCSVSFILCSEQMNSDSTYGSEENMVNEVKLNGIFLRLTNPACLLE